MSDSPSIGVFVLTHNRVERIHTLKALDKAGWSGPTWLVVDDGDPALSDYREEYGDRLLVFSKDEYEDSMDFADQEDDRRVIAYARMATFDLAEQQGLDYVMMLDDDYDWFRHRVGPRGQYLHAPPWIEDFDAVFRSLVEFMETDERIVDVAMSQGGDWIGGANNEAATGFKSKRKAMNSHIVSPHRRFEFQGRHNEDVSTYVERGNRGMIFLTFMPVALNQKDTQSQPGGMTESYLDFGTYAKSFYTVLVAPHCTKIATIGDQHPRLHHRIDWNAAVPKIVSDEYAKGSPVSGISR